MSKNPESKSERSSRLARLRAEIFHAALGQRCNFLRNPKGEMSLKEGASPTGRSLLRRCARDKCTRVRDAVNLPGWINWRMTRSVDSCAADVAPWRHVRIPFVVLVARRTPGRFPFQLPGPLGPLTFRARPLIHQSDEKGAKIKYK